MSGEKKKIENLLEEALISEDEQLYEIPKNWVWVRMGEVISINPSKPKLDLPNEQICSFLPMNMVNPQTGRIDNLEEREFEKVKKGYTYFKENDVLFAKITPCMENGNTVIAKGLKNKFGFGSTEFYVFRTSKYIDERYVYYLLRSEKFRKQAKMEMTGAVGQQRVPKRFLESYPLALPPLNEQKRIVERIEQLLNKIEGAKQLIEGAKETFEIRRAAILDKAFRGGLTQKWRRENSLIKKESGYFNNFSSIDSNAPYSIPNKWKWLKLKDLANFKNGYAFKSKDFVEKGIQLVRMGNLYKNKLALDRNPVYMPLDYNEKIIEKYTICNGDILLSLTGTKYKRDYGYAVKVENLVNPLLLNQRILSLRPLFINEYIFYYLQSPTFRNAFFSFETGGVNQGNVASKAVESILIPVPPIEEAEEIGKMLNRLLDNEKQSLDLLAIEGNIETLKQSILSKAFQGKMGMNNPDEENALELLKKVLQEKLK
ncbi:restriction endonuclease subunit S [Priestia megaterium]|uniref:Restriction endonuclease subunit S n=1 Tax=Priestia megaterium TaxID=1404 RepID=A0A3D8WY38_PRIMG|nr:restriction endonuclease subunit S [Priestia megaterium]MDH3173655.1 restriction endonuclease subunit S [Priestia megaterium]RDZ11500.1 restriction endonuclease subunit S [Priestia megaterium]